jgi:hypothetical protein
VRVKREERGRRVNRRVWTARKAPRLDGAQSAASYLFSCSRTCQAHPHEKRSQRASTPDPLPDTTAQKAATSAQEPTTPRLPYSPAHTRTQGRSTLARRANGKRTGTRYRTLRGSLGMSRLTTSNAWMTTHGADFHPSRCRFSPSMRNPAPACVPSPHKGQATRPPGAAFQSMRFIACWPAHLGHSVYMPEPGRRSEYMGKSCDIPVEL